MNYEKRLKKIYDKAESAMKFQNLSKSLQLFINCYHFLNVTNFDSLRLRFRSEKCSARQIPPKKASNLRFQSLLGVSANIGLFQLNVAWHGSKIEDLKKISTGW